METINKKAKISVLIATRNRPAMLKVCIESLLKQKIKTPYEIIILDQSDSGKQITVSSSKIEVKIIQCNFKNKSRALNLGVKLASADYIAVIDDDCIADRYWVDSMHKAIQGEGQNSVITGRVIAGNEENHTKRSRLHDDIGERTVFKKNIITPIFKLSGCNLGFHKTTYEIVGPFNENLGPGSAFKSSDDNEWSYRALNLGYQIIYVPQAVITHRSWRSAKDDIRLLKDYGYAAGAFFKLIFKTSKLDFWYHSVQLWRWLLKTLFFSFNTHEIVGHIQYGLFFCRGFLMYHHCFNRFFDYVFVLSPGKYIGGAERYIQNLIGALQKQGQSSIVVAISHNREFYLECKDNTTSLYLGNTLKEASAMLSHFLRDTQTTVVSSGYHSSYLVFLARLMNLFQNDGCKFIDIKHGWIKTSFSERFKTFLDKLAAIFSDLVVLVNPSMVQSLWFINKKKLIFIPSGILVENNFIHKQQRSNPFKILLIGRLAKEKRFDLVIKALSYIPKSLWRLTVIGDGPEFDTLQHLAIQNNISERIDFVGYQKNVFSFYEKADLLIISSANEGCPLVALEAMAYGVLVLSTNVGYMPKLLAENRGILIDVNITVKELSKKIKEIAELSGRQRDEIINNAQSFVYKNHNLSKNVELFKNIISRKSVIV